MKRVLAVVLATVLPMVMLAGDNSFKVIYDGGSVSATKAGTDLKLFIDANQIRFVQGKKDLLTIPATSVTEISYGQDVHRRVGTAVAVGVFTLGVGALVALSKSKKHYVGLVWANGDQKGGLAMQCDKTNIEAFLLVSKVSPARRRSIRQR